MSLAKFNSVLQCIYTLQMECGVVATETSAEGIHDKMSNNWQCIMKNHNSIIYSLLANYASS